MSETDHFAPIVAELAANQEITEILYRYARGWDRYGADAIASCFHPDSTHAHGGFEGLSADFIAFGLELPAPTLSMSHPITNVLVELAGDLADSECSLLAHHRHRKVTGGGEEDMFIEGRYLDRFERRDGRSRTVEPADETLAGSASDQLGRRKPDDPLYALLAGRAPARAWRTEPTTERNLE
jgi:hypothetical protein